uniref:Ig-like domain-containing protein n=1 Tax=Coturnix japonica TaxID=93934 RepID=A0A8C2T1W9_COTJA
MVPTPQVFINLDQETPIQSPVSITKSQGNADLKCHFKDFSGNFDNTVIHWYQQKENKAPVRMIYFSAGRTFQDEGFQRHRYRIQTISGQKICTLTIRNIILDDAATYYCAYWDPHRGRSQMITTTNTSSAAHRSFGINQIILQRGYSSLQEGKLQWKVALQGISTW